MCGFLPGESDRNIALAQFRFLYVNIVCLQVNNMYNKDGLVMEEKKNENFMKNKMFFKFVVHYYWISICTPKMKAAKAQLL